MGTETRITAGLGKPRGAERDNSDREHSSIKQFNDTRNARAIKVLSDTGMKQVRRSGDRDRRSHAGAWSSLGRPQNTPHL